MSRFAIGDIHGCALTFQKLVEDVIKLRREDSLFLLGDLVNKGPNTRGVLDFIFKLKAEGYNVLSVKGNHDKMFLEAYYGKYADYWTTEHAEPKTVKSFGVATVEEVPLKYFDFIKDMPFFLELDNCFLVHAGFNFALENPFSDFRSMLHLRKVDFKPEFLGGKSLVHGHVPTSLASIQNNIKNNGREINLDAGCVYHLNEELGNLVALDLDTKELFVQHNIDKPYHIDIKKNR